MIKQKDVINDMVKSLMFHAKYYDKSLDGITEENYSDFLDDLFDDGGEIRCEYFTDLAIEYSLQFGELESMIAMGMRNECVKRAVKQINKK